MPEQSIAVLGPPARSEIEHRPHASGTRCSNGRAPIYSACANSAKSVKSRFCATVAGVGTIGTFGTRAACRRRAAHVRSKVVASPQKVARTIGQLGLKGTMASAPYSRSFPDQAQSGGPAHLAPGWSGWTASPAWRLG